MEFEVNGVRHTTDTDDDPAAVEVLRDRLGLTGTKLVCGGGVCGACTVQVDGDPRVSCLTPAALLAGRRVTTAEGLADHPVARAFAGRDALQCGYCTPGFVVEAAAFHDRWRAGHGLTAPGREQIADALAGHLCRCGAYERIFEAVTAACTGAYDGEPDPADPPPRAEAPEKACGAARYTTDLRPEGLLEGVVVRSPHAHALVRSIDAGGLPLVRLLPPDGVVRYAGQPVAAVAAPTRAAARAAAGKVVVDYEVRPAALDVRRARAGEGPLVYPDKAARKQAPSSGEGGLGLPAKWEGNRRGPVSMNKRGGEAVRRILKARAKTPDRLVEGLYTTAAQSHTPLEPHTALAHWTDGTLRLEVSTQAVQRVAQLAAERWGLPPERVIADAPHVGGGFGSKVGLTTDVVAAVELSRLYGAPVRVSLDRDEELTDGGYRPATRIRLAMAADTAGDLSALAVDADSDGGVSIGASVAALARFMYGRSPRRLRDFDTVTNRPPGAPFRGPGGPPLCWALEQAVDEMAHRLGHDPIDLRRQWDGNPKRRALYDWAAALPVWTDARRGGTGRYRRGVGVAAANWLYFVDPATEVELTVEDGTVVARCAVQDMGTGSRSVLRRAVADGLGIEEGRVRVEIGRSGAVHGPISGGSRTTPSLAPAARDAADRLRAALGGGDVASRLDSGHGTRVTGRRPRDRRGFALPFTLGGLAVGRGFTGSVQVAEVEVDTRLGRTRALRVWSGISAGRIHEDRLARNQCEGAVVQGVGYALYEERRTDPRTGRVLTENLEDYRIPGIGDTPEITVHFHQEGFDHVPGGGVGLGEVATLPTAAALGNAVYDATGWRPYDLPIRPDRLLEGLRP
ncbi:xanthine dehydrogenase YagR molybdenum-binding subunit [Streptomyces sp. 3211.6]|uniref:molybdopterin-dependent oxidoreductase n=1 Tax=Streptomyces sp. 3211.6 TaxID=1938845 RepID=UPI000EB1D7E7|nr:molybdopterin cofactor-binding domain-containing protein [Streptomyces sp. 3211.6]RKT03382.1 xanthine dehydrogenase YagR molybdenum-binding subunit [Streptomyces sp. 3211.6]